MIRHLNRTRLRFALLALTASTVCMAGAATAIGCGGISDPNANHGEGRVATVSGALTGSAVPANARVALVWHKITTSADGKRGTALEVGDEVPIVDGKFTMNLGVPAADRFMPVGGHSLNDVSSPPPTTKVDPEPAPAPVPAGSGGGASGALPSGKLTPRDTAVGGSITEPLTAAIAGFVVYVDGNGNGKLDLEGEYASSPDQILGGNKELILAYLKDGGALDYEKLRDKSGILPTAGFNLAWDEGRWLPLNVVELQLSAKAQLPSAVCDKYGYGSSGYGGTDPGGSEPIATTPASPPSSGSSGGSSGGGSGGTSGGPAGKYPSPTDPGLSCSPDGTSFVYYSSPSCPPPPPAPVGLCAGDYGDVTAPCAGFSYQDKIPAGGPVPEGWPCVVTAPLDGGSPDAGPIMDAGAGPG